MLFNRNVKMDRWEYHRKRLKPLGVLSVTKGVVDTTGRKHQTAENTSEAKRVNVSQADVPKLPLSEAIALAKCLSDNFASKPARPHQLAMALNTSPTSSKWRVLSGASMAYGLTDGSYSAQAISLTDLGKRLVAPTEEGDDSKARIEAILRPRIASDFFGKYDKAKFPQDAIAKNVLADMGVPTDRLDETLEGLKQNGRFGGIIHDTKTGPFVAIDTPASRAELTPPTVPKEEGVQQAVAETATLIGSAPGHVSTEKPKVFIAHGKNKDVAAQLKDLLVFGKFTPVIAEEHVTTSIPIPDKVFSDMRSCSGGIIHVASEDELLDKAGGVHHKINENVLTEIGASMALYGRKVILLVQKGVHLPSNLQGLYICYYEGDKLDYEATMKLLKALNEFA